MINGEIAKIAFFAQGRAKIRMEDINIVFGISMESERQFTAGDWYPLTRFHTEKEIRRLYETKKKKSVMI